jgi:hypothetical protein
MAGLLAGARVQLGTIECVAFFFERVASFC